MTERPDDGGCAFPRVPFDVYDTMVDGSPGMSLRDYFAGQAIAGFLANPTTVHEEMQIIGEASYRVADLMLIARNKGFRL